MATQTGQTGAAVPRPTLRPPSLLLRARGREAPQGSSAPAPAQPTTSDTVTGVISDLTRYIPSEAIALYVGILPFLLPEEGEPADYTSRFVLAGAVAAFALLYAAGAYKSAADRAQQPFRWPWKRMAIVLLAFVGWVLVIPGSPFNAFNWYSPDLGAILGVSANAAINLLTLFFGVPTDP